MSKMMYKGIECRFTAGADALLDTEEEKLRLLDHFFKCEPINSIKWVTLAELEDARLNRPNYALPMYSVSNGTDTVLLWPILEESADLFLSIETLAERPDVAPEIGKPPCDECGGSGYGIYGQPGDMPCCKCNP